MQKYCHKSFNRFDIFGSEVGLIYKNDNLYRTAFGGLITIFFGVILVLLFFHNFATLVQRSEVKVVSSTSYDINPSVLNFTLDQFMIAVKIDQVNFINRPTYQIGFERRHYYTLANGTYVQEKVPVFLEPCTMSHFSQLPIQNINWTEQFQMQGLDDYLCLRKNESFPVGGRYQSPDFFHLKFTVTQCSNKTNPISPWQYKCASNETIQAKLANEDNRVLFLFSNFLVQPEKSSDITTIFLDSLIFTIQPDKMYTTANIFMNEKKIETDHSIFPIKSIGDEDYMTINNGDFRQQNSVGKFAKFCEIFFLRSTFSTAITRQFMKIDEVISYIGGFSQMFLLVSTLIVSFYNEYVYYLELANRLYDFDIHPEKKNTNKHPKQMRTLTPKNQGTQLQSNNILSSGQLQQKTNDNLDKFSSNIKDQDQSDEKRSSQQSRRGTKKVTNREDIGLMPLEEIRNIICTRKKTYINMANNMIKKRFSKQNDIPIMSLPQGEKIQDDPQEQQQNMLSQNELHLFIPPSIERQTVNEQRNQLYTIQSENRIKEDNSPSSIFTPRSPQNFDSFKYVSQTPLAIQKEPSIKFNTETYTKSTTRRELKKPHQLSFRSKGTVEGSPEPIDSQNNILQSYQKNVFEGLGFNNQKQFLEKELEFIVKRDRSLKISYEYFINMITCGKLCNTEQVQLLGKANELVRQDLDIFNVLDKIKEVEKLKKLLLTHEELVLFNFFPKPVINVNEQAKVLTRQQMAETERDESHQKSKIKLNSTSKQWNITLKNISIVKRAMVQFKKNLKKNRITQYETLYDCYDKITQNSDSKYKKQLIQMLGDEVRNIFEVTKLMQFKKNEILNLEGGQTPSSRQYSFSLKKQESHNNQTAKQQSFAQLHKQSQFKVASAAKIDDDNPDLINIQFQGIGNQNDNDQSSSNGSSPQQQNEESSDISIELQQMEEKNDQNQNQIQEKQETLQRNLNTLRSPHQQNNKQQQIKDQQN